MSKNEKTKFSAKRIAVDALLIALEFTLSTLSAHMEFGGVKISFVALPIVLCALLYGPADAVIIAFLGEFLMQIVAYGLEPTTLLWCIPETVRALILGIALLWVKKTLLVNQPKGRYILYYAICIFAAAVTSVCNTVVYSIYQKMLGEVSEALTFGVLWIRLIVGTLIAILTAYIALLLARRLRAARLV